MIDEAMLAARSYGYALFQTLLGSEPTAEALGAADGALLSQACEVLGTEVPSALIGRLEAARASEEERAALASEYTRALVGPGALPASPWETTHVTGSDGLFSRVTLEVRNAYRAEGLLPEAYPRVSDDHIALECGFLAALAARALNQRDAGDEEACARTLAASADFLEKHLLRWAGAYAEDLASSPCTFYAAVGAALAAFAARDAELLEVA